MRSWKWLGLVVQRLALLLIAGLLTVLLLHVQTGILQDSFGNPIGFSAQAWLSASGQYLAHLGRGDLGVLAPLRVPAYMQEKRVATELITRAPASLVLLMLALPPVRSWGS